MIEISLLSEATVSTIKLGIAGLFGVMLRMFQKNDNDLRGWVIEIVSGILIAIYSTPVVAMIVKMDERTEGGVAFLLGYTGMVFMGALQKKFFDIIETHK